MTARRLVGRIAALTGAVAVMLDMGAASAATQMFKCVSGGRTIYQQQACPVTSEPASAPAASPSTPARAASAMDGATTHKVKPASRPASAAPATRR